MQRERGRKLKEKQGRNVAATAVFLSAVIDTFNGPKKGSQTIQFQFNKDPTDRKTIERFIYYVMITGFKRMALGIFSSRVDIFVTLPFLARGVFSSPFPLLADNKPIDTIILPLKKNYNIRNIFLLVCSFLPSFSHSPLVV